MPNNKNKTANTAEMTTNQQGYSEGFDKIYIDENGYVTNDPDDQKLGIIRQVLQKADFDPNKKYSTNLSLHNTGTSLDISAYNAYSGDGTTATKPTAVILGVAGTKDDMDWAQNKNIERDLSQFNGKSDIEIKNDMKSMKSYNDASAQIIYTYKEDAQYELEIREKVRALETYRKSGVPISIVGDSKGGEDAAYLALSYIKSTLSGTPDSSQLDYSSVRLYVTNPKEIRVSDSDYKVLEKMAEEGCITVEVVYPEILSTIESLFGLLTPGRDIPYSNKIYTVPVAFAKHVGNHTIGDYENDVYQGVDGQWKFQCITEPERISGSNHGIYRYHVTSATSRSGRQISITEYFFEEKTHQLNRLDQKYNTILSQLEALGKEQLYNAFKASITTNKPRLKIMHEGRIAQFTDSNDYAWDVENIKRHVPTYPAYKDNELNDALYILRNEYEGVLRSHVEGQSSQYESVVMGDMTTPIIAYEELLSRAQQLVRAEISKIDDGKYAVNRAKEEYIKSNEQLVLTIEKSIDDNVKGF